MSENTNILFDTLTTAEIDLANETSTDKEQLASQYNKDFPRDLPVGIRHLHFYLHRLARSRINLQDAYEFASQYAGEISTLRLVHLSKIIKNKKPRLIYEFGADVSTLLMAQLIKPYGGKIVTFEQSPEYYDKFNSIFPLELKDSAEIKLCPVRLDWFGDFRGIYYEFSAPEHIDFVYIDGATRTRGNMESDFVYPRVNADIVRMQDSGTIVDYAVTDHRWANFLFYKESLSEHSVKPSRWWKSIIIKKR